MRMYTDSADAIKAYAEEVNFDLSKCVLTEHEESKEYQRGGLTLAFKNYHNQDMQITVVHNWMDTFDVTFWSENKTADTLHNQYFDDLLALFHGMKLAMTGISQEEWSKQVGLEEE